MKYIRNRISWVIAAEVPSDKDKNRRVRFILVTFAMPERFEYVDLGVVRPNRLNPRLDIGVAGLNELADSIRQMGIIEPLVLRPVSGGYEVVVGERRYRAAQQAGLGKVPAIIREYSDNEVMELNLVENVQREDLSAVEKGNSVKKLMEVYPEKYPTVKDISDRIGLSESTIRMWLELVSAPRQIQKLIAPAEKIGVPRPKGKIDYDTAFSIIRRIKEPEKQIRVAQELAKRPVYRRTARQVISEVSSRPDKSVEEIIDEIVEAPYELPFRLEYMKPILDGTKTQTSRRGIPDPKIREGAIVHAAIWEPHFADLLVTKIERKKIGDFTGEDAKREGGYTLEDFRKVWKNIHNEWDPDATVYVIHFERIV